MTTPMPRFAAAEAPDEPERGGFLRAVLGRVRPRLLLFALGSLAATQLLGRMQFFRQTRFVMPPDHWKTSLLVESLVIAFVVMAVVIADEAVSRGARRWPTYLAAVFVACALAAWAQWELVAALGWDLGMPPAVRPTQPLLVFFGAFLYSTLACCVYVNLETSRSAAQRMHQAALGRAQSRRRTLQSRLQAMQARVEPQFLFNTLAQVRELYDDDPAVAGRVLDDLISYLRAALPHLRESSSTLGQEIDLARAYLDIMRVRLGDRLRFEIDVPEAARSARMPPMMLLPLIDHALVHGLQPSSDIGSLAIRTEAAAGRLRLTVTDSGVSFLPDSNGGQLENIAQRLTALYGDDARFELDRMRERGTRATLEIPYEHADSSDR